MAEGWTAPRSPFDELWLEVLSLALTDLRTQWRAMRRAPPRGPRKLWVEDRERARSYVDARLFFTDPRSSLSLAEAVCRFRGRDWRVRAGDLSRFLEPPEPWRAVVAAADRKLRGELHA